MRRLFPFLVLLLAPCAWGQKVQSCEQNVSGSSSVSCSLSGVSANHLLVGSANLATTGTFVSIADGTLTWTCAATDIAVGATGFKQYMCYAETGAHTGTFNTTLTVSANITNGGFAVVEYANFALSSPQDGSFVTNSGSSTCVAQTDCTVSVTTSTSTGYIVSLWWHNTNSSAGSCCTLDSIMWDGGVIGNYTLTSGANTSAMVDSSSGTWQGLAVAFKRIPPTQSPLLVQEAVIGSNKCSASITLVTCSAPSNVTSGNPLVIGIIVKRQSGTVTWTKSDTMNITGTSGWQCSIAGPNVPQGITGEICVGFPSSTGPEAITFTETTGDLSVANAFISEWKPQVFSPCGSSCTFLDGPDPNCCLSPVTSVSISTTATSSYTNNFSIASIVRTFPATCGSVFWTAPSGTAIFLDPVNQALAYAFQPSTSGGVITETLNCGSGDSGSIVWGGVIFSSTYAIGGQRRRSQVY